MRKFEQMRSFVICNILYSSKCNGYNKLIWIEIRNTYNLKTFNWNSVHFLFVKFPKLKVKIKICIFISTLQLCTHQLFEVIFWLHNLKANKTLILEETESFFRKMFFFFIKHEVLFPPKSETRVENHAFRGHCDVLQIARIFGNEIVENSFLRNTAGGKMKANKCYWF